MNRRGLWASGVALILLVVGAAALTPVGAGYAKDENASRAKCSEATLKGTYLFAQNGVRIKDNDQRPFALAGYDVFDGNGEVKGLASGNFNGEVFRNDRFTGTYTVKANCTGTLTSRSYLDPSEAAQHLFEGLRPDLNDPGERVVELPDGEEYGADQ
jgi:hypothetical protein